MRQWISYWCIGRSKIRIITVKIAKSNGFYSPFVLSGNGMLGKDYLFVILNLSRLMAEIIEEPISHIRGLVNGWIAIAVMRFYSRIIRRACLTSPLWDRDMYWDSNYYK